MQNQIPDWMLSFKDYWFAVISALIGAGISIAWTIWHFKSEKRQRQNRAMRMLKDCVAFNLDRLRQAENQLGNKIVPNYPLDTSQMNYWLTECTDILPNETVRNLDSQRYQLDHLSQKFLIASVPIISTHLSKNNTDSEYSDALVESLRTHVSSILNELSSVKTELDTMASNPIDRSGGSAAPY
jgi:hypothetical protein